MKRGPDQRRGRVVIDRPDLRPGQPSGNSGEIGTIAAERDRAMRACEDMARNHRETIRKLVMLLDASIPALEAAAKREAMRKPTYAGLRNITEQERVETVRQVVKEACDRDPDLAAFIRGEW